jgi:hypothetical protein
MRNARTILAALILLVAAAQPSVAQTPTTTRPSAIDMLTSNCGATHVLIGGALTPGCGLVFGSANAPNTFVTRDGSGNVAASTFNGNTLTAGTYTLTGAAGKTLTFSNSLTLAGTDGTTITFPSTSASVARTDAAQTFTGTQTFGTIAPTTINAFALAGTIAAGGNQINNVVIGTTNPLNGFFNTVFSVPNANCTASGLGVFVACSPSSKTATADTPMFSAVSNDAFAGALLLQLAIHSDATPANRYASLVFVENGVAYRGVSLAGLGGYVTVGSSSATILNAGDIFSVNGQASAVSLRSPLHVATGTVPTGTTGTCVASSFAGGATAGTFSAAICTATNTFVLSALPAAPTGYSCDATDRTTSTSKLRQTASSTTSATFTVDVATVAADVVTFKCLGY